MPSLTDGGRAALHHANREAKQLSHEYIGTEHLLLGLLREEHDSGAALLARLGITGEQVRGELFKLLRRGPHLVSLGKLPLTSRARRVIEYACEEAGSLGRDRVGTDHLLMGLAREEGGVAQQVLQLLGADVPRLRAIAGSSKCNARD